MLARIPPNLSAAIPFIAHHALGSTLGPAWPSPLDGPALHELFEDHRLMSLPRREHQGHQLAAAFGAEVDFGTEAALAAA
jgi:hypothetical protein